MGSLCSIMLLTATSIYANMCRDMMCMQNMLCWKYYYDGTDSLSFVDAVAHTVHTKNTSHYLLRLKTTVDGRSICRIDQ